MDLSFFWHDYETFGRDTRRDRPAQFAGLRTDAELRPTAKPVELYCQPPRDRLPEPEATLLTGITPQRCAASGLREYEFAARIEAELSAPGTVGVGYNSIRFDDEVTRHLFWRNLIDPYAREWQNGCGRWDLMDTVRCAWALRPDGLEWPRHDDGRVSFKLEHLSAANNLQHEAAHDALSDVHATLALARRVRDKQPKLFDFCLALRRKDAVWQQIGAALDRPFLHVSGRYAAERGCIAMVWPLAPHPVNKNELIVWDLASDPAELFALDADAIRARLFVATADLPEGMTRLPIKTIHINRSPVVIGNLATLGDAQAERWGLDKALCLRHAATALRDNTQDKGLWQAVFARPEPEHATDVEEDLYGGFLNNEDRRRLDRLRALPPDQLAARHPAFDDARLDELLLRYRARNAPDTLDAQELGRWQAHCIARLHHGEGGGLTLAQFQEQIDALSETADERAQELLGELVEWAEEIAPAAPRAAPPRAGR